MRLVGRLCRFILVRRGGRVWWLSWIRSSTGRYFRVDFLWEKEGVIGEADGLIKYSSPEALRAEKIRQEDLEVRGFQIVRWTLADMSANPERIIARISEALGRRGWGGRGVRKPC